MPRPYRHLGRVSDGHGSARLHQVRAERAATNPSGKTWGTCELVHTL